MRQLTKRTQDHLELDAIYKYIQKVSLIQDKGEVSHWAFTRDSICLFLILQGDPTSHPKGDQSWVFIGRTDVEAETPVLWSADVKSWLFRKDPDAGKDWEQEEQGMTEDEMVGWYHPFDGHESEWTPGVGDGQGGLACCDSWGRKESDTTERLNWTELDGEHKVNVHLAYIPTILFLAKYPREIVCFNSMFSQRVGHDWATELNWTDPFMASTYWGPCLGTDWGLWRIWILKFAWWVSLLNSSPLRTVCSSPALLQVALLGLQGLCSLLQVSLYLNLDFLPSVDFLTRLCLCIDFFFSFFPLHAFWPSWAHPWPFSIRRFRNIFQALTTVFSHHLRHILVLFFCCDYFLISILH